ncbi:MAG: AAA family ATPase, partial [Candidatus Binatia bacterium]
MYKSFFGFREAPFSVTPDPAFFYVNSQYQEAFATLRYGIAARKGLIVVTGEVGTGKTTLLRKLMSTLEANTHSALIFQTHLSFTELLRLIFRDLGLETQGQDRLKMLEEFTNYLTEQFHKGDIVSLLVDEAQNLSDPAFEGIRFLSNLETRREKLLQIVLIGQPELEGRLDQPRLRHLKQRIAIRCHLDPLPAEEVRPYIDFRLKAAGYEGKGLFPPDAVEKIAFYAKGTPRLINTICDNAMVIAYASSKKKIDGQTIEQVARDLRIQKPTQVKTEPPATASAETKDRIPRGPQDILSAHERWESAFAEEFRVRARLGRARRRRESTWAAAAIMLALVAFAGAGIVLYSQETRDYLWDLGPDLEQTAGTREQEPQQQARQESTRLDEEIIAEQAPLLAPGPGPQDQTLQEEDENRIVAAPPETKQATLPPTPAPGEVAKGPVATESAPPMSAAKPTENKPVESKPVPGTKTAAKNDRIEGVTDSASDRQRLQLKIYKAIQNRAIAGVEVSTIGDTAYLGGRVETERQRDAAEKAARSVPGVRQVRN